MSETRSGGCRRPGRVLNRSRPASGRGRREDSMIANYTDHAANERTFLAWIRTGLAVAAFGFFLVKLDVLVDTVGGGTLPRLPAADTYAFVVVAARYVGLAMVVTGV